MLKEQTWRALLSSWEKTVKYETSFILCFKTGKTHANRLSCLIVCTFIWLLNPTNCFPPLFVCSATPKFISVFLSCLSQAQQKWPRALCVCDPATVCCQETPVCYVALQPNALHCQLVLVLWNTEGEQCTLCHCAVSVWLIKRPCTVSAGLGHWDLCWNGVIQLELYVGGFCFALF